MKFIKWYAFIMHVLGSIIGCAYPMEHIQIIGESSDI